MKFIRKKNFLEGEELLYVPKLHWMFTVKHMVQSLPFFLVLLIMWMVTESYAGSSQWLLTAESAYITRMVIKNVFLASLIIVLLIFVWRIFLYLNTEYGITNKRLIIRKGIIRLFVAEIPTDRIESIYCVQGLLGRIFHYGTIFISGIGGMMPVFYMVSRPYALRRKIVDVIERNKTLTVVYGELPRVKPAVEPELLAAEKEEEPMYRYGSFVRVLPGSGK